MGITRSRNDGASLPDTPVSLASARAAGVSASRSGGAADAACHGGHGASGHCLN